MHNPSVHFHLYTVSQAASDGKAGLWEAVKELSQQFYKIFQNVIKDMNCIGSF